MPVFNGLHFRNIRGDIFGGVTAAVVALPLALAFGVASGAGPIAGIYGAICIGFFAALFGGTPSQISGPTGPMTVVMAAVFTSFAAEPMVGFTVVIMAGAFQILFGVFRLGRLVMLVPYTVVSGFMSGIGLIIIILQIAPLLGHTMPDGGIAGTLSALPRLFSDINMAALAVGAATFVISTAMPTRLKFYMPPPVLALLAGTAVVWLYLPGVPVLGEIPTGLPDFILPSFDFALFAEMLSSALVLALLGSIDSLLTSLIADQISHTRHNPNRELIGQGIGNMAAGFIGGIPGAGATMRTVANIKSGGQTPLSGMLHALLLLAIMLGLGPLASHIPHAVLAGILLKVGIDIMDWRFIRHIHRHTLVATALMLMVMGLTVFVDLIVAVSAGMIAASLLFVQRMSRLQLEALKEKGTDRLAADLPEADRRRLDAIADQVVLFRFEGPVTFGIAKALGDQLKFSEEHRALVLDFSGVTLVDTSAMLAIEDIVTEAQERGMSVIISGLTQRPEMAKRFKAIGTFSDVPRKNIVDGFTDAVKTLLDNHGGEHPA